MTFEEYCRDKFRRHVLRLAELVGEGAPDVALAIQTRLLWDAAEGAFGEALHRRVLDDNLSVLRDRAGFCRYCDTQTSPALAHPPVCGRCDARLEREAREIMEGEGRPIGTGETFSHWIRRGGQVLP